MGGDNILERWVESVGLYNRSVFNFGVDFIWQWTSVYKDIAIDDSFETIKIYQSKLEHEDSGNSFAGIFPRHSECGGGYHSVLGDDSYSGHKPRSRENGVLQRRRLEYELAEFVLRDQYR